MACRRVLLACLAVAALAGCGAEATVTVRGPALRVALSEYRMTPQDVRVPAGRLTLAVRNDGVLVHDLALFTTDRSGQPAAEIAATPSLHPGERARLSVTLRPGRYAMVCTIGNHADLGQTGTLTATAGRS